MLTVNGYMNIPLISYSVRYRSFLYTILNKVILLLCLFSAFGNGILATDIPVEDGNTQILGAEICGNGMDDDGDGLVDDLDPDCANIILGPEQCGSQGFMYYLPTVWGHQMMGSPQSLIVQTEYAEANINVSTGDNTSYNQDFIINRGNPTRINLPDNIVNTQTFNSIENNKGLIITSNVPIQVVYAQEHPDNQFRLTLKGEAAPGRAFRIISPVRAVGTPSQNQRHFVSVMATEDNTDLTFDQSTYDLEGWTLPGNVSLQAGETILLRADNAQLGPQGLLILANNPVVVNAGAQDVQAVGTTAHSSSADQIVPVEWLGKEHILIRGGTTQQQDYAMVMAVEENTTVFLDGVQYAVLNPGEVAEIPVPGIQGSSHVLTTTESAYVFHCTGIQGDIFDMTQVPPLDVSLCRGVDYLEIVPAQGRNLAYIIVPQTGLVGLQVNGQPIGAFASLNLVPGNSDYYTVELDIDVVGTDPVQISSSTPLFISHLSGDAQAANFNYFSNYQPELYALDINGFPRNYYTADTVCAQDNITHCLDVLSCASTTEITAINGNVGTVNFNAGDICFDYTAPDSSFSDVLQVSFRDDLGNKREVCIELVVQKVELDVMDDTTICEGESIQLDAYGAGMFSWNPADSVSQANIANPVSTPGVSTTYQVTLMNQRGCQANDSVRVEVLPSPRITVNSPPNLCPGDSAQLEASGAQSYIWTPSTSLSDANIPNPLATPLINTTYTVTGEGANGCTATADITVAVFPGASTSAGPDTSICPEQPVKLQASGGLNFTWKPSASLDDPNKADPIASPDTTTVYTVVSRDLFGCLDSAEVTITVDRGAPLELTADTSICLGENIILSVREAQSYLWTPAVEFSDNQVRQPVLSPGASGTYQVEIQDSTGCIIRDSVFVGVNSLPMISTLPDTSICEGIPLILFANGGIDYIWYDESGFVFSGEDSVNINPSSNTFFSVNGTDALGCVGSDTVRISVIPAPTISISNDTLICRGDSIQLNSGGGVFFQWAPVASLSALDIPDPLASPDSSTTYSLTITGSQNCTATDSVTINLASLPGVNAGSDTSICRGDSIILQASGAISYQWKGDTSISDTLMPNPLVSPSNQQVYILRGFNAEGCSALDSVLVDVLDLPTASAGIDLTICEGDSIELQGSGGVDYNWSPMTGLQNSQIAFPAAGPSVTTEYILSVSDQNGCQDFDSVMVFVNPLPVLSVSDEEVVCIGDSAMLSANGAETYLWLPDLALSDFAAAQTFAYPDLDQMYIVSGTDSLGCTNTDSVLVRVVRPEQAFIVGRNVICTGTSSTLTAEGAQEYLWSTGELGSQIEISPQQVQEYWVVSITPEGCVGDTAFIQVETADQPEAIISASEESGPAALSVSFENQSTNAFQYVWDFGDGGSSDEFAPDYIFNRPGVYEVSLLAINDSICTDTALLEIKVFEPGLFIPSAFTPNDDGINDSYLISNLGLQDVRVTIYNRWGKQVFISSDNDFAWDGKINGIEAPEGVYTVHITGITASGIIREEFKSVTLLR